nr:MAG TPA: holin [Caudoviricetes sp.]
MSNKVYDILKFIAQIILPAVATLYTTLADIWGLPYGEAIPLTIMALDTFLGAILMISSNQYNKDKEA